MSEKTKTTKTSKLTCPACSGSLKRTTVEGHDVMTCRRCEALVSEHMYLGDSYSLVLPYFAEEGSYEPEEQRYFDLTVLGSRGVERRHGWYVPRTRRITQVG